MRKLFVILLTALILSGCASTNDEHLLTSINQVNGVDMGCMSGSIFDVTIHENFKDSSISYYNSRSELVLGLISGKIDAYLADEPVAMSVIAKNKELTYLKEPVDYSTYGICFSKESHSLLNEFNEYLRQINEDGFNESLINKWMVLDSANVKMAEYHLSGENGTIKAATTPDAQPFSFMVDGVYQGYEVELVTDFCYRYGYDLVIDTTNFDALLSSIATGKYDLSFNGIYITDERKKSVEFCDPLYRAPVVAVVRNSAKDNLGFFESIKDKIKQTFVEEDRWKLIIQGINTTLLITALSLIFGTILAFIFMQITISFNKTYKLFNLYCRLISGLPTVVLLMILFYVVFAKSSLSGTIISIIGFALIVSSSVYKMLEMGLRGFKYGEYEGALALGYTENQAYYKIVLPQVIDYILPSYKSEIVSLVKSTSVVGYVTVQDVTRVSDIIRSRTFDAFFPLIVTAIIYFVLSWLLIKVIDKIKDIIIKTQKKISQ